MKRKYLLILYLVFVCVVLITSSTLAKYIHTSTTKTSFTIGDKLYFIMKDRIYLEIIS